MRHDRLLRRHHPLWWMAALPVALVSADALWAAVELLRLAEFLVLPTAAGLVGVGATVAANVAYGLGFGRGGNSDALRPHREEVGGRIAEMPAALRCRSLSAG